MEKCESEILQILTEKSSKTGKYGEEANASNTKREK
jgi:hypothetical protein